MVAGCGANCMKYTLFIFNILFFLAGVVLAAVGGYVMFTADALAASLEQNDSSAGSVALIKLASIVFIIAGLLLVVICFFGCCGAIKEIKCMLGTYAVLIGIVIIAELVVAIRIFMFKGTLDAILETGKEATRISIRQYGSKSGNDDTLDEMMQTNECCGGDHWTDFKEHATEWERTTKAKSYEVPLSCCKLNTNGARLIESNLQESTCPIRPTRMNSYIGRACNEQGGPITGIFRVFFFGIIGVVFGLIAIELVGIIFAICLIRYIGDPRAVPV